MSTVIESLERAQLRRVPQFDAGDRLRVHFQVIEGTRRRTQVFEGVVIKRQGHGARETFTVRKQSFGVGVERTFPLHSPKIENIEVAARGDVRRAKLYYLRDRVGKRARVREKRNTGPEEVVQRELLYGAAFEDVEATTEVEVTEADASEAEAPEVAVVETESPRRMSPRQRFQSPRPRRRPPSLSPRPPILLKLAPRRRPTRPRAQVLAPSGTPPMAATRKKKPKGPIANIVELVATVAVAIGLALLIQSFLVKPYRIPSGSMIPTLKIGQRILVSRLTTHPGLGDIVVFHPPAGADTPTATCGNPTQGTNHRIPCDAPTPTESQQTFVKRVVGLPGDHLRITVATSGATAWRRRAPTFSPARPRNTAPGQGHLRFPPVVIT